MGIVLDTENIYRDIFKETMRDEFGMEYDDETHRDLSGLKTIERCKYLIKKFSLDITVEQLNHLTREMTKDIFLNTELKPGNLAD